MDRIEIQSEPTGVEAPKQEPAAEAAAKAKEQEAAQAEAGGESQGYEWKGDVPEKFQGKTPEEVLAMYAELEKKLGGQEGRDAEASEDAGADAASASEDEAREVLEGKGIDMDGLFQEYAASGQLGEDSYAKLEKAGIPKETVDAFIAGQEALAEKKQQGVFDIVGGKDAYYAMIDWARNNLNDADIAAYDEAIKGPSAHLAVEGLKARYTAAEGQEPKAPVHGDTIPATSGVYRSLAEMQRDMSDPRYKTDPAFRKDVERKLAKSNIF